MTAAQKQNNLWTESMSGNKKSLVLLWEGVSKYFKSRTLIDATGVNTEEDKMSILSIAFFDRDKWKGFDPSRGVAFNTWMYRILDNHLKTTQNRSFALKNMNVNSTTSLSDIEEYSVFVSSFVQSDFEVLSAYKSRIETYLNFVEAPKECLGLLHRRIADPEVTVKSMASDMGLSVTAAYRYYHELRQFIIDFMSIEKNLIPTS